LRCNWTCTVCGNTAPRRVPRPQHPATPDAMRLGRRSRPDAVTDWRFFAQTRVSPPTTAVARTGNAIARTRTLQPLPVVPHANPHLSPRTNPFQSARLRFQTIPTCSNRGNPNSNPFQSMQTRVSRRSPEINGKAQRATSAAGDQAR
jgi:hypothetical protein